MTSKPTAMITTEVKTEEDDREQKLLKTLHDGMVVSTAVFQALEKIHGHSSTNITG